MKYQLLIAGALATIAVFTIAYPSTGTAAETGFELQDTPDTCWSRDAYKLPGDCPAFAQFGGITINLDYCDGACDWQVLATNGSQVFSAGTLDMSSQDCLTMFEYQKEIWDKACEDQNRN